MPSFVYVLIARTKSGRTRTYVGWTLDLERRLKEHNGDGKAGTKFTRGAKFTRGQVWSLVYAEKYRTRRKAMAREYALKRDRALRAALRSP